MEAQKQLFLTIDDFPSKTSGEMLAFLNHHHIPAILFCIGNRLEKNKEAGVDALKSGFILGNHSYTHPAFSAISLARAYKEIDRADAVLSDVYARASIPLTTKYFRFPYGDKGDGNRGRIFTVSNNPAQRLKKRNIQRRLAALNYTNLLLADVSYNYFSQFLVKERDISWTLDVMEWCLGKHSGMFGLTDVKDVLKRLFSENPFDCRGTVHEPHYGLPYEASAEVLLMHDHEKTISDFKIIVTELINRGYSFGRFV